MGNNPLKVRHEFLLLFDVTNGNPNGDPDAGNMPRMDPETGHGIVSDVCLKRKVRNYIEMTQMDAPKFRIYVTEGAILNDKHREAYRAERGDDATVEKAAKLTPKSDEEAARIRRFMCDNFFDIRTFGGVLSTGINAGQVRGPVQFAFSRSIEPVLPLEVSITRMAATTEAEKKERVEGEDEKEKRGDKRTMGRKHIIPYGLYRAHGFVSAHLASHPAKGTGFTEGDLDLLFEALEAMFEHDHSAARGEMATRKLIVFRHATALGNAPAHSLFDRVKIWRSFKGETYEPGSERLDNAPPARAFSDYAVTIDRENLPDGVEIIERL
ncbi:type I-C CRISPR-associated protein Cas7/Csd2 [Afifella sp. H1R]|uniref:type I-C CRISPR-associated protein Cas7/Csd2 n=1 Tax=Afifella sp. H1R TaxID=2908841 RepID=UPI001F357127|nr:type I-C CRISPR-associated protein Cas7/Csd2 [Afifella sp. H1R]MCF1503200.1 type I-C CRISPR-associated protein Cas7/Csd2 [Afifella sp. H1R]